MFDNSLVVQSAASSFNNAALFAPDFFWTAVLALPLFAVCWIFAPQIADRFFPNARARDYNVAVFSMAAIAVWIMSHQNFSVLRDGASIIGILCASVLAACIAAVSRKYHEQPKRPSQFVRRGGKWIDFAVPAAVVAAAGIAGDPSWRGFAAQAAFAAGGWACGWLWAAKSGMRRGESVKQLAAAVMFVCACGMVMQPEFFRFGQMGRLTVVHLLFLAAFARMLPAYLATRLVRPSGWLSERVYRRLKLLFYTGGVLALASFIVTESLLVFMAFALGCAIWSGICARHAPPPAGGNDAESGVRASRPPERALWILSLGAFGVLAALPLLTCAAIMMWRTKSSHDMRALRSALL